MRKSKTNPVVIQAIWHRASAFTREQAEAWCQDNDFKTDVYRTDDDDEGIVLHHIHAQFPPDEGVSDSWAMMSDDFPDGIIASVCQRKEKSAMKMHYTKGVQSADDPMEFVMSTEAVDRMGDVIKADGWDLSEFKNNPICLFSHSHDLPIGTWEKVRVEGKRLIGRLKMAAAGTSAAVDTVRALLEQRILKAVSVGFMPEEYEERKDGKGNWLGITFTKQILNECSVVSVPANSEALQIARSFGMDKTRFDLLFQSGKTKGQNAAPLARIDKAIGTAAAITANAGRPTKTTIH